MPGNTPEPTSTKNNNTPKVETVEKSNAEEEEKEKKEAIQDEEGFQFQVNSPLPEEQRVWEASRITLTPSTKLLTQIPKRTLHEPHGPCLHTAEPEERTQNI